MQRLDTSDKGISSVEVETYSKPIEEFHEDIEVRFQDVFQLEIPNWIIIDPFIDISEQGILAGLLIPVTLQNDFELKSKFSNSYQAFWLQSEIKVKYPKERVNFFFIAFTSSYLVERAFHAVRALLDKRRYLLDKVRQKNLRLFLTKRRPDIKKLMKLHPADPSFFFGG